MAGREMTHFPAPATRRRLLVTVGLVVAATSYAGFVKASAAPRVITDFEMGLTPYAIATAIGLLLGAVGAMLAARTDLAGRTRLLTVSTGLVAVVTALGLPASFNQTAFLAADAAQSGLLGAVWVCALALARDYSPLSHRASAMGAVVMSVCLGGLAAASVSGRLLGADADWQTQYYLAGAAVALATAAAAFGLRDVAPELRRQTVRTDEDRQNAESRTAFDGIGLWADDTPGSWRDLMTPSLLVPMVAFGLFSFITVTATTYGVLFFVTAHGFVPQQADGLGGWWWIGGAGGAVLVVLLANRLGPRKPALLGAVVISAFGLVPFLMRSSDPSTPYDDFVWVLIPAAIGMAATYALWLTLFTEAVEEIDPELVGTGLAVCSMIGRVAAVVAVISVLGAVRSVGTLVDHGPEVNRLVATYSQQIEHIRDGSEGERARARAQIAPADLQYLVDHLAAVYLAVDDTAQQWRDWWRLCLLMQLCLIPSLWLLPGPWRRAPLRSEATSLGSRVRPQATVVPEEQWQEVVRRDREDQDEHVEPDGRRGRRPRSLEARLRSLQDD
ncbi:MFS transporter [Nocardioides sp. R-C-SC26]|uniref:MFS transporter n=1 Tax=Nocardioides sp. R-C-SC26 TaxID=2870414 RepID=UPI001E3BCE04|nr:MFS transporter [Nocardioides sp. R-C-SC26]